MSTASMPGFQIILTSKGPIIVPVPAGWEAVLGATELVLSGDVASNTMNVERVEITLRWDDAAGQLKERCRMRQWGMFNTYDPVLKSGG